MEEEGGLKRVVESLSESAADERSFSGTRVVVSRKEVAAPETLARSLGRDSEVAGPPLPAFLCAICTHSSLFHTVGTDGAGWCAGADFCDCGGFQG